MTAAIALLTGGRRRAALVGFGLAVTALPWLGVKYAPVAVALVVVAVGTLLGERRLRAAVSLVALLGLAGVAYLGAHRLLYGGWTVYATGDHFTGGELTVMGRDPDYLGRTQRLGGLLLDRGFGLAAWMPAYLLAVPALCGPGPQTSGGVVDAGGAARRWLGNGDVAGPHHARLVVARAPGGGRGSVSGARRRLVGRPRPGGAGLHRRGRGVRRRWRGAGWWSRCSIGGAR